MEKSGITRRQALEELAKRKAHKDFWKFCLYLNFSFWKTRENEIKEIAEALTLIYETGGKIAIHTPPRVGKSTLANHFIAWCLLKDIDNAIIRASYSQTLSSELNQGARQIIAGEKYQSLLNSPMEEIENSQTKIRFKGSHRANLYATSVGGSATGFGGNIIIADDLYKDHLEALSDTINRKTINWYHSAFTSRLDGKKQIEILIGTRWRIGELADTLIEEDYFDETYNIKALVDGKSFNEEVITTKSLLMKQRTMHSSIFNSMYQQEPMESMESLIPSTSIKYIDNYKPENYRYRLMVADIADTGDDRTTSAVLDIYDDKIVVVDLLTDKRQLEFTKPRLKDMAIFHQPTHVYIEDNAQAYFARLLVRELQDAGLNAQTFYTSKNKRVKILLNSAIIKQMLFLKNDDDEYNEFIRLVCKYDLAVQNQHDDEIDILAIAVDFKIELMDG